MPAVPPSGKHAGFTFVELLCALTLSALLVTTVMGTVGLLKRRAEVVLDDAPPGAWQQRLKEQVASDIASASQYEQTGRSLVLLGFASRDFESGRIVARPSRIEYTIRQSEGVSFLFRRETHLDDLTNHNYRDELVCLGASEIRLRLPGEENVKPRHGGDVPGQLRLQMLGETSRDVVLDLRYCQ